MEKSILERFGFIIKKSNLSAISKTIDSKYLLLKENTPFQGYYQHIPTDKEPLYVYIVIKDYCSFEQLVRASIKIRKRFDHSFSATAGSIQLPTETVNVIRVRHLESYDLVKKLITYFIEEGIRFAPYKKNLEEVDGIIKLKKFFFLQPITEGVYLDAEERFHGYFHFRQSFPWSEFEELTQKVLFNWERSKFDAAIGCFYVNGGLQDMIRIYNHNIDKNYLLECKALYERGLHL